MKAFQLAMLCAASVALAHASDYTGVYARIDKVVLEPNAENPERAQIWGVFAIAKGNGHEAEYEAPARGYLYFSLDRDSQSARAEWNDLKQVAGSGEIVAFGMRGQKLQLRKVDAKPESPDPYMTNYGVVKVRSRTDYPPVKALLAFKD